MIGTNHKDHIGYTLFDVLVPIIVYTSFLVLDGDTVFSVLDIGCLKTSMVIRTVRAIRSTGSSAATSLPTTSHAYEHAFS